jgi:hypothetical protein
MGEIGRKFCTREFAKIGHFSQEILCVKTKAEAKGKERHFESVKLCNQDPINVHFSPRHLPDNSRHASLSGREKERALSKGIQNQLYRSLQLLLLH